MRVTFTALALAATLAGCASYEPYWFRNGCVADDDKITIEIVSMPCNHIGWAGCTQNDCNTRSAKIEISQFASNQRCLIAHEWNHAKGWGHRLGAYDCEGN